MDTSGPTTDSEEYCVERNILDVDGYERTVAGVRIEGVRTGKGVGPNHVLAVSSDQFTLTSCEFGFPMRNRTTIGDGQVVLAHIDEATPGSKWCDLDLEKGSVISYGPGAEHTAVNLPGLKFTFVVADIDRLSRIAEDGGVALTLPARGEVRELEPSSQTSHVGAAFRALAEAAHEKEGLPNKAGLVVLPAMLNGLRRDGRRGCSAPLCGAIDSRHVVHLCMDYADATDRMPSVPELCAAAAVSERRLRKAFVDEFEVPPSRFFRYWALTRAHKRLQAARREDVTVTHVAAEIGFGNLGRFAAAYQDLYGAPPSATLRGSKSRLAVNVG